MTDECKLGGGDTGEEGGCLQAVVCRLDGARERKIGRADRKGREGGRWRGVVAGSVHPSRLLSFSLGTRACGARGGGGRKDGEQEEARLLPYCGGFKALTYCRPQLGRRAQWPALMD